MIQKVLLVLSYPMVLLYRIWSSFKMGARGYIPCKKCGTPEHVTKLVHGYCSFDCWIQDVGLDHEIERVKPAHLLGMKPEWATLRHDESTTTTDLHVYIDNYGGIYLEDYTDEDNVGLKEVGHEGYSFL